MKKGFTILLMAALIFSFSSSRLATAANLADGTYTIPYTMLKADSDSASIANGYFEQPADLIVKNGEMVVRVKLKQSDWIQAFSTEWNGAQTPVNVVSKDAAANARVVEYKVKDLSQPLITKMHVVIPEQSYDSQYTVRQSFDLNGLQPMNAKAEAPAAKAPEKQVAVAQEQAPKVEEANVQEAPSIENPKTGEASRFGLLMTFFFSALFIIYRMRARKH